MSRISSDCYQSPLNNIGGRFHCYCYPETDQTVSKLNKNCSKECYLAWEKETGSILSDNIQEFMELLKLADINLYEKFSNTLKIEKNNSSTISSKIIENTKIISAATSKPQKKSYGNFSAREALAVLQHEVGVSTPSSEKPILGSFGAGPCIIVAFNPKNQSSCISACRC